MDAILKQKKIVKGKLTRLVSKIDDLQNQANSESIIEVYEKDVNLIDTEVNYLNNNLLSTCTDEDFNGYEIEMHNLFSKLDTLKIILKEEMKKLVRNDNNINACQNNANTNVNNLKLPRIELPVFTSNYMEWISFRDLFLASVGNNNTLSDRQKLQYFKLSVKGEAATLLQSIQITNYNYQKAWNALTERYENEAEIINAALNKLVSQPVLKQESASGLRKIIDTTQQCIDTLQILKQPVEHWDTLIIFLLRGKLDPETLRVWTLEQTNKKNPSFAQFKSFVLGRATAIASLAKCQKEKTSVPFEAGGNALILPKITCDLPQFQVDASALNTFKNLQLADINCLQPSSIDILLGADVFGEIMLNRHLNVPGHSLTAMETIFGWIVLGKTKLSCQRIISNHASYNAVEFQLDKFWQLEELSETKPFTNEEIACENHFKRTYTRDSTGRFAVKFPFRDSSDELGSSRDIAVHRLQQIERRFSKNQSLSDQYHKFMDDYLKLGHMELISENEIDVPASSSFYLPHHPVPNKNGDKFRVDAQNSHNCGHEKMYRQITLHDSDFQRIVWRNSPFEPIQDFRLTRIAYGIASSPNLAIKCLQQLALNESNNFPLASKAALKDYYVDDLMSGANSLSEALELQNQLTQMVSSAGLVLRKWASNCSELLNSIDSDMRLSNTSLNIDNDDTVKTLGILWHPVSGVFYFKITPLSFEGTLTKRTLLSTIAKTFDPLGWLSPITIQYKTIMQRLWKQQLKWDERVPTDIKLEWEQLANGVQFVKDIKIPRFLLVDSDNQFHLFGFSDASEKAYAAAIYCRSVSDTGKINIQLIIAKTRVAPLKTVSLPRLELCGALLLVKL
ncbi:integrase catalytic domain-containing protein [Trichonephila clavata]|uniref:Integrase catalytic domain-containing protein n=1 Tax=Trichonephila clavata TaxID=2740835 RepID=A0A8X6LWV5_TRICU|nr:integrase catalytic domain-containing protein [Trichonephila clavata]